MQNDEISPVNAPRGVIVAVVVGWLLVIAKCVLVPIAFQRWGVPVNPGWVILPTLVFAALVTGLVAAHDWEHDED